jgi:cytochrome c oxidase subunit 2
VVHALPQAEFDEWLAGKKEDALKLAELTRKEWTFAELMSVGEVAYGKNCASCHQPNGQGLPPTFPALKDSDIAVNDLNAHLDIVINGSQKNPAMAAFGPQLSEVDIAAIITYERNAWGNDTGDVVTPLDILNYKSGQTGDSL